MRVEAHFNVNIKQIMRNIDSRVGKETVHLANIVWGAAVDYSPVWTGAYQASWSISFGSAEFIYRAEYKSSSLSPPTGPTLLFTRPRNYEVAYVTNGAPYAEFVEYGGPKNPAHYVATRAARSIY